MRSRRSWLWLWFAAEFAIAAQPLFAQVSGTYRGRPVQTVIEELQAAGAPLVYSTNLLPDSLLIETEPTSREPLALARELLRPHGLTLRESGGAWLVVRAEEAQAQTGAVVVTVLSATTGQPLPQASIQLDGLGGTSLAAANGQAGLAQVPLGQHRLTVRAPGFLAERVTVDVAAGVTVTTSVPLLEAVPKLEELTVTASRYDVVSAAQPSVSSFSRDEIETMAELGDDTVRVAHRLPGVAANEFSARSHVRGGAANEMTVLLDGMRLIEPFHLRDYQGVFSSIDQRVVSALQIYSGGFPAMYGDSLSGLMVIESREPAKLAHEVGVSLLHTAVLSSGTFADGRGSWLASARRSNLGDILNSDLGDPAYHDTFMRIGMDIGAKHRLTISGIALDDDLVLAPSDAPDEREEARTEVDSHQFWVALDSRWTDALSSRSWLYLNKFASLRQESVFEVASLTGSVTDRRQVDTLGIKQEWRFEPSDRQLLRWGFEAEEADAVLRYSSSVERRGLLATLGGTAPPLRSVAVDPDTDTYSVFVSDRLRLTERWIAELGVRWDQQSYSPGGSKMQFSPRSSLLYRLGSRTDLRFSYGRFFQAEGLLDLQVQDGVGEFAGAQNASHSIIGIEQRLARALMLRVEVFRKWSRDVRPRYENLFDPLVLVAELRAGRVLVAPERAETRGIEILLSGGRRVPWWLGYSLSRAEDLIDNVWVPRSWDQRHALDAGLEFELGRWSLSAAASVHSGWPGTAVTVEEIGGQFVAVAGVRNALRLRSLRRLDFRASRELAVDVGSLHLFAELTNFTNRRNPCCLSYEEPTPIGTAPTLRAEERPGLPLTGNLGFRWEF